MKHDGKTDDDFINQFDLSKLKSCATEDDINCVKEFLKKWKHIFSKNNKDIKCTDVLCYCIDLLDERPIKQPGRRIPPNRIEVRQHLL